MALVVDTTPLSPTCNSYASLEFMATYVAERVPDTSVQDAWDDLDVEVKSAHLVNASRTLDSLASWIGDQYSRDQKLRWPRFNAWVEGYLLDVTTFPQPVVEATCEMALWLMGSGGAVSEKQDAAYDSLKVGPITVNYNGKMGGTSDKYFPDIVAILLEDLATMHNPRIPSANQVRTARLERA